MQAQPQFSPTDGADDSLGPRALAIPVDPRFGERKCATHGTDINKSPARSAAAFPFPEPHRCQPPRAPSRLVSPSRHPAFGDSDSRSSWKTICRPGDVFTEDDLEAADQFMQLRGSGGRQEDDRSSLQGNNAEPVATEQDDGGDDRKRKRPRYRRYRSSM
ncbi:hypothetical protein E2562_009436 [Oryza meyeriana var. granulata]|uniref:Uncharacterized protein n=1 Tax=Oryza meyeriana var. granulata TaxID=110450 RepID=A0A6G1BT33_9ORYZ|nr:hypothetical protein E2562_009436 [Oryza meyeriana var. granulata]